MVLNETDLGKIAPLRSLILEPIMLSVFVKCLKNSYNSRITLPDDVKLISLIQNNCNHAITEVPVSTESYIIGQLTLNYVIAHFEFSF